MRPAAPGGPGNNRDLGPAGHGDSADAAPLPLQIDDRPAAVALLDAFEGQAGDFGAAQAAAQHEGQDDAIAFALQRCRIGRPGVLRPVLWSAISLP